MGQAYTPNLEIEVTLWRRGDSFGTLPVGLGLKDSTQQLVFYFGKLASDGKRPWWMVAERHALLLEFFLEHKICFDGPSDGSRGQFSRRRGRSTWEIHLAADSYERFQDLLLARVKGEPVGRISPKKMYALVEILALIINQMDLDMKLDEGEFDEKWDYFLDILEEEA